MKKARSPRIAFTESMRGVKNPQQVRGLAWLCARLCAENRDLLQPVLTPAIERGNLSAGMVSEALAEMAWCADQPVPEPDPEMAAHLGEMPEVGDYHLPGLLYNELADGKRSQGSHYTPRHLAEVLAERTLRPLLSMEVHTLPRVIDPAVGAAHLLTAAGDVLAGWLVSQKNAANLTEGRRMALAALHGVDCDPTAMELARLTLWLWSGRRPEPGSLVCGDSLMDDDLWQGVLAPPFEAVIGNPPFASVFTRSREATTQRARLVERFQSARRSFDLSVPFTEHSIRLTRPGGRCGLVLPNKLLAADYASPLREWIGGEASISEMIDTSADGDFVASVYPTLIVFERRAPVPGVPLMIFHAVDGVIEQTRQAYQSDWLDAPDLIWGAALDAEWETLKRCWDHAHPLGGRAEISAGLATAEAYHLKASIVEVDEPLPDRWYALITTGAIGCYESKWGCKPTRFLNGNYVRPALPGSSLPARRFAQTISPKVIIGGIGIEPRAWVDREGHCQASVATVIITGAEWPLDALCAWLNSEKVGRLYRALFGSLALSGGYLRIGQRELALLPLPDVSGSDPRIKELARLGLRRAQVNDASIEVEIAGIIDALYGFVRQP
jgi:hypothetical protein